MKKLLIITSLVAVSMLMAKPAHKGGKPYNKGSVNSSLKGANSVVKPNKYKKHKKHKSKDIYKGDRLKNDIEREVTKSVIRSVL